MAASPKYKIHDADGEYAASCKDASLAVRIVALLGERAVVRVEGKPLYRHMVDGDADESIDLAASALLAREAEMHKRSYAKAYPQAEGRTL